MYSPRVYCDNETKLALPDNQNDFWHNSNWIEIQKFMPHKSMQQAIKKNFAKEQGHLDTSAQPLCIPYLS